MMKIKFDSEQSFQKEAVASIVDLFDGQPLSKEDFTVEINTDVATGQSSLFQSELGIGNNIVINEDALQKNLAEILNANNLDVIDKTSFQNNGMNFSVEMETGTGKT